MARLCCRRKITWNQYRKRFISEIKNNPKAIQAMKIVKSGHYDVVLMRDIVIDPSSKK